MCSLQLAKVPTKKLLSQRPGQKKNMGFPSHLYISLLLYIILIGFPAQAQAETPVPAACPLPCLCETRNKDYILDCRNQQLLQVPAPLNPIATQLFLANNRLTRLTVRQLQAASQLTHLDASNNSLQNIEIHAFSALSHLESLDLAENPISHLPYGIFAFLPRLRELSLSHCRLRSLNNQTFFNLPALSQLSLQHNALKTVHTDAFWGLKQLKSLHLSANQLESLAPEWFYNMPLLEKLFLDHNLLRQLGDAFRILTALQELDLSYNQLNSPIVFPSSLRFLNLASNNISALEPSTFQALPHLDWLNLSENPLTTLPAPLFQSARKLKTLFLSHLGITELPNGILDPLTSLSKLDLTENAFLAHLESDAFHYLGKLKELNLSYNALRVLPRSLRDLPQLGELQLRENKWQCDCQSFWVLGWFEKMWKQLKIEQPEQIQCQMPSGQHKPLVRGLSELRCTAVRLEHSTVYQQVGLGSEANLTCRFSGIPLPRVQWHLPDNRLILWPSNETDPEALLDGTNNNKTQFTASGDLLISSVARADGGRYICVAFNPLSNVTAFITLQLDPAPIRRAQIMSLFVGLACCTGFVICALIGRCIKWILDRCGWWNCYACCGERLTPRAKQVRQFLEGIESYKSQQLDKLRENYHGQAQRIKENCMQQVDRLRDSYTTQVNYLRGVRDSGTHHLTSLREQYNEQVRRVYNYSMQSMDGVRTNYVSQRNRVRKFSAHQLVRLKESYRFQQKTINKILENLPSIYMDSCRNPSCGRTDSIYFDDDIAGLEVVDTYIKSTMCTLKELEEHGADGLLMLHSRESSPEEGATATSSEAKRGTRPSHSRQGSLGSLDLSALFPFPPLTLPHRLSRKRHRRDRSTRGEPHGEVVQVAVEVCQPPSSFTCTLPVEDPEPLLPESEAVPVPTTMAEEMEALGAVGGASESENKIQNGCLQEEQTGIERVN